LNRIVSRSSSTRNHIIVQAQSVEESLDRIVNSVLIIKKTYP